MQGEFKLCAHSNHLEQPLHPHRPARVPTFHSRFHYFIHYIHVERAAVVSSDTTAK